MSHVIDSRRGTMPPHTTKTGHALHKSAMYLCILHKLLSKTCMLAPRIRKHDHISDDSKLDHVVQKLWEVQTGGRIRQTLMTAVDSDSALWTTWTITLPELMLTPPISVQSFSVSFTGDACSSQLLAKCN
jgi:hypothetical protein